MSTSAKACPNELGRWARVRNSDERDATIDGFVACSGASIREGSREAYYRPGMTSSACRASKRSRAPRIFTERRSTNWVIMPGSRLCRYPFLPSRTRWPPARLRRLIRGIRGRLQIDPLPSFGISRTTAHVSPWRPTGIVGSSHAPSGIYPGGIRSNFGNEESIVSQAWPRMLYVTTCGLNWPGSSRLVALTAISSGIATNVR